MADNINIDDNLEQNDPLDKKFVQEEVQKTSAEMPAVIEQPQKVKLTRKFEIAVYDIDEDDNGLPIQRPVAMEKPLVVEANSPKELNEILALFKMCGLSAKIIREIDPPSKDKLEQLQKAAVLMEDKIANKQQTVRQQQYALPSKPKYYRIGDIDIKNDNGKIYLKQWIKLTDSEESNFRIINDKNNSIVKLVGKHLEMKKWILVEDNDNDDAANILENLK